jgi:hypothetical protein|tara:strand:- start:9445 stop:9825 length:381 start_codon:yes stop_codon:yes gene_type:complete
MPQIDKITYFNQLFWLFLSFSFYYCVLLKVFLPKISSVLKARKKKLAMGSSGSHSFVTEKTLFTEVRGLAVENCLSSNAFSVGQNSSFLSELNHSLVKTSSLNASSELQKATLSALASHNTLVSAK